MAQQIEGTSTADVQDSDEFVQWLKSHRVKPKMISKLTDEFCSIDELRIITDDKIDTIMKALGLNDLEQNKFRYIHSKAKSDVNHTIIDKEEAEAILKIDNKVQLLQESLKRLSVTKDNIDAEIKTGRELIEKSFGDIIVLINKRKQTLLDRLDQIGNDKKNELDQQCKATQNDVENAQNRSSECHLSLRKPLEIQEMEDRKKKMLKMAKEIENIKIISASHALLSNNKIQINMRSDEFIKSLNNFGSISGTQIPVLVSLTDNEDSSVTVHWRFDTNINVHQYDNMDNKQIKIEWTEIESKDNDNNHHNDDMKVEWNHNKIFDINNDNQNDTKINITVNKVDINYLFKVSYYDSNIWSKSSNIKSIFVKLSNDEFMPNTIENNTSLDVNNQILMQIKQGHGSTYCRKIVESGKHVWKFKILNVNAENHWFGIGIWKVGSGKVGKNKHFMNGQTNYNKGYGLAICYGVLVNESGNWGKYEVKYGVPCKADDIVEMILDINLLELKYIINGKDYGKAFTVSQSRYKAAVDMYYKDSGIQLLPNQS